MPRRGLAALILPRADENLACERVIEVAVPGHVGTGRDHRYQGFSYVMPRDAMHNYFAGQRIVAITGALVPAAYLLIAWAAFIRATHPARSFAITVFALAGAFMLP
jgi:hypothetical protein